MRKTHRRMSLPVKIITWFIGILVVLAIVASIFVVASIFITSGKIHNSLNRQYSELRSKNVSLSNGDPFTIALFGVDSNAQRKSENDGERSDTIMLLSINPKKQTTEIVSVPRDTQAEIVGKGTTEKINHAYAYGGPTMAVKSLEKLMNVPIDHYATVDMDGLHDMIDALGGVNVTSNDTFTTKGTKFVKGQSTHVDGDTAMAFMRSRKEEGAGGDFGRQERQQLILQAMANKMTSTSALTHFPSLINQIQKNVKTDLTLSDMNDIRKNYKNANTTVNRHQLEGQGGIQDDGLWYFIANDDSKQSATEILNNNLQN
ncbi:MULTISPECIES: LCP family protein [Staphylococcus]|uniref:LytR family transcriptional regulator n=1 Tax=Staphylococcus haemolyticus TaxID=1283 RepID=A0A2K0A653_STAHA|nr:MULTISPECIES: LCP family protein [Staphylococcus]KGF28138.1 LytR family transcriptional regulator [Staphylococcus haemolyticus DNF00585]MCH4442997.1 LCP family protein [Staphylococcus haemolyticus]OFK28282.1 LytR family transcriptional regulator [Staphylococcus sp. HMSC065C10]OFL86235.1 LytR family transcriptional regulator [Staphylococcus sp. HMSC069D12]PNN20499.1 LytR family transcriptional regulator [Staphylococcus haemolyticus]